MIKFFVSQENILDDKVIIKGADVNHIKNVLRLTKGKEILISDGQANEYKCIIESVDADVVTAKILDRIDNCTEPKVKTILFQSLVKGEKMELVIQKGVEIGVTKIIPIITKRCVVKLESEKKLNSKIERWQKISEGASKQSKRGIIPEVCSPMTLKEALVYATEYLEKSCIPYENEDAYHMKDFLKAIPNVQSIGIFIGPEGGFTEEEVELSISLGIQPITLGKRILRSETAGLVALSNIMYEMGDR